ncbi:COG1361 S-layer family protein [Candidatus Woesearchaeota archaeon]|nr:COG1361 S-layer family protein [Candidatus Woesearchaeota archaeon]
MKKKIILIGLLLFSITVTFAAAGLYSVPQMNISLINQDPDPVGPSKYVDVRFKIQNNGVAIAEDVNLELVPKFPFSLDENEVAERYLGNIPGYGASKNVIVVKYKVRVDRGAVEGENVLHLRYKLGDSDWITQEYPVNIQTIDATVSIESVESIPSKIRPGEPAKVKIKLKNIADSVMEDISLKFDLGLLTVDLPSTTAALSYYDLIPFAPLNSATEKKVKIMRPGEEVTFIYDIIAYANAEPRVYKIPIEIKYYDELNTEYVKNDIVGLMVGTKPDICISIDETDLFLGKTSGEVVIKFINKGFTDVKFLYVNLENSEEYEILSSEKVYLGNLDSDDYETAEYKIFIKPDGEKSGEDRVVQLPLAVEYKDANNEAYSDQYTLELVLRNPKKLGMGDGKGGILFVIVVVLVVGGFLLYRRMKSRKRR